MIDNAVLEKVNELLKGKGDLLYLSKFGAHLYGLERSDSDLDYRGVFLPNENLMLLDECINEISFSTGDSCSKNTSSDVDIKLFSIHKFIKLASQGDTNALDLLFSYFAPIDKWEDEIQSFKKLVYNREDLINAKSMKAFYGYAISQAKKYGIKGSRFGVLKDLKNYLNSFSDELLKLYRLEDKVGTILKCYKDPSYCFETTMIDKDTGLDCRFLCVCGTMHSYKTPLSEFKKRIIQAESKYGERVRCTEVDWKALSHAIRALDQCIEFLEEGKIYLPLRNKKHILEIKLGNVSYEEVEKEILEKLDKVQLLQDAGTDITVRYAYNKKSMDDYIINLYMKKY